MAKKNALIIVIAVFALVVLLSGFTYVPEGSTGVVKTLGMPNGRVFAGGVHLKAPFVQSVEMVNNNPQSLAMMVDAITKDGHAAETTVFVNYEIRPDNSLDIVRNIGALLCENKILIPAARESVKSVTAKYTAEGLITERAGMSEEIARSLEEKVSPYGITVEYAGILNYDFGEAINRAIEEKLATQ